MTPYHANDHAIEKTLLESDGVVVIAFLGCESRPCEHFKPELWPLAEQLGNRVIVLWTDVDENPTITEEMGVRAIPTVQVYRDGERLAMYEGPYSHEALIERIRALMEPKRRKG